MNAIGMQARLEEKPEQPGAALARFAEARGRRTFEAAGTLWTEYRGPFYVNLPYQEQLDPDPRALGEALRTRRVAAVRYLTRAGPGWPSGLYVASLAGFSMQRLARTHRSQVKKGLGLCDVRPVDPDQLLAEGLEINLQTMARQGRFDPEFGEARRWRAFVAAIRACPAVRVSGAFLGRRLSAYVVACRDGEWLHLLYKMSRTEDLIHRTNPALDYWILSEAASDPTLRVACAGFLSTLSGDGTHQYKLAMGWEVAPRKLGIRFHPALQSALANRFSAQLARGLERLRPRNRRLELLSKIVRGASLTSGAAAPPA